VSYKIIKKEKGGNVDRPNQGSERHVSDLLNLIAPNECYIEHIEHDDAREFDDPLNKNR